MEHEGDGLDARIQRFVDARGRRVLAWSEVMAEGGTVGEIRWRLEHKRWQRVHAGVVLIGAGALTREEVLISATLAADGPAVASALSVLRLYGLGDFMKGGAEITVAHETDVVATGVKVHRTRRPIVAQVVCGVPCTSIEQALLDVAPRMSNRILHQLFTSAWRRHLTTPKKLLLHIEHYGGRGVRGTPKLRAIAQIYEDAPRPPGSEPEADFLWLLYTALDAAGIERPVIQLELDLGIDGKFSIDLGWKARGKLIEVMGASAHADYVRQDEGYERGALIRSHGWDLRDVAPRAIRERPEATVRSIITWLLSDTT